MQGDSVDIVTLAIGGSLAAGLMTAIGAAGVGFVRQLSERLEDGLLSFAAGIMLAASFFSLLLPAIGYGEQQFGGRFVAVLVVIVGFLAGAITLSYLHRHMPHEHFHGGVEGPDSHKLKRIWLFVLAITLHNFPEGMAVGAGFAGGDLDNGTTLATGIGIQNIPEGLAVAISLIAIGYGRMKAFLVGALTGLVEPIGGLVGGAAVAFSGPLMPLALAFAAGAMLFVISDEIIPETHRRGFESVATFALLTGFALMMLLDATLG